MHRFSWICTVMLVHSIGADVNRFVVTSGISTAIKFYPEVRDWPTTQALRSGSDVETTDAKRQMCRHIISCRLFSEWRLCLRDTPSSNYRWRTKRIYVKKHMARSQRIREDVFQCETRRERSSQTYYISKEYNLNASANAPHDYVLGRFIFHHSRYNYIMLYGLVELPAKTFSNPDHDIERLYGSRRRRYSVAFGNEEDALCKLDRDEHSRICVAVFNSHYFEEKLSYSDSNRFDGYCGVKTVSFQTEYIQRAVNAVGKKFKERMLKCKRDENFEYLLSQAYHSGQAFVYSRDRNSNRVFPEVLVTNLRLEFSEDSHLSLGRPSVGPDTPPHISSRPSSSEVRIEKEVQE